MAGWLEQSQRAEAAWVAEREAFKLPTDRLRQRFAEDLSLFDIRGVVKTRDDAVFTDPVRQAFELNDRLLVGRRRRRRFCGNTLGYTRHL